MRVLFGGLVVFVAGLSGCGSSFSADEGSGGGGAASGGSGAGTGAVSGASGVGGAPTLCPPKPAVDSDCSSMVGRSCSYGTDPRPSCRARFACNGQWKVVQSVDSSKCNNFGSCPPTVAIGVCTTLNSVCTYEAEGVFCRCSSVGTLTQWRCSDVPGPPCPQLLPNEGEECSQAMSCNYGCPLNDAITAQCDGQAWFWMVNGGC